jgi:ribosomal protein S17
MPKRQITGTVIKIAGEKSATVLVERKFFIQDTIKL